LRHGHTGVERFILNLIRNLHSAGPGYRFTVFLWGRCSAELPAETATVRYVRIPAKSKLARALYLHFVLPLRVRSHAAVLFTGYLGSLLTPCGKSALWVYDLIALEKHGIAHPLTRIHYRLLLPHFLRTVSTVFCPSESVRQAIDKYRPGDRSTYVRRLPVEECFYVNRHPARDKGVPSSYFLTIGYSEPKKNHHAIARLAASFPQETFVVVGKGTEGVSRMGGSASAARRVLGLGYVPQDRLVGLLAHCRALIFPSLAEGYGYPVAEALVMGRPVICYPIPPLREFDHPLVHFASDTSYDALQAVIGRFVKGTNSPCKNPPFLLPRWTAFVRDNFSLCSPGT
jgi:glycosyltransferase involved in cell wall biosynthesis